MTIALNPTLCINPTLGSHSITAVKSINLNHPVQKLQQKQKKINQEQYNI